MQRRPRTLLIAGLVLGLLGAAMVMAYVRGVERRAGTSETATVWLATRDIPAGSPSEVVRSSTRRTTVPRRYVRPGAVTEIAALDGRYSTDRIATGDQLTAGDFAAVGATRGSLAVPAGMEAVAVATTLDGAVGRYPEPGDTVNVYGTFTTGGGVTRRILAGVRVLASRPADGAGAQASAAVVYLLAVAPEDTAKIVYGQELGRIRLSLVPDGEISPPAGDVTLGSLR